MSSSTITLPEKVVMFCDKILTHGAMLRDVWKLAHNIEIEKVEQNNLPKICNELNAFVTSESIIRVSLRASSNLIGGTAKMYQQSLGKLYDDVIKLDQDFIYRRRRYREREQLDNTSSESVDSMAESIVEDPEQMQRSATVGIADSSFSPKKVRLTDYPIVRTTPRITMTRPPSDNLLGNVTHSKEENNPGQSTEGSNADSEDMGTNSNRNSNGNQDDNVEQPFSEEENSESQHKTREDVKTSPILTSRKRRDKCTNTDSRKDNRFDRNLPFGYIMIHDTYGSRIPSKIIFTSINSDINNLI